MGRNIFYQEEIAARSLFNVDVAGVNVELGGRRNHLDELLLAEVLKTTAGEGDGDLEAVGDDGGSDDLVLGDFTFELLDDVGVEEDSVVELLTGLTLRPLLLLGVGARTGLGGLGLLFLSLLDLRGHVFFNLFVGMFEKIETQ